MPNYRKARVMLNVLDPAEARSVKVPGGTQASHLVAPSTVREVFDAYYISERFQRKSKASRNRQLDNASALTRQAADLRRVAEGFASGLQMRGMFREEIQKHVDCLKGAAQFIDDVVANKMTKRQRRGR